MSIKESITIQDVLEVLNRAHTADPDAMCALVNARVPCNEALANDPTIQVGHPNDDPSKGYEVGLVGVLNGLFGADAENWGTIAYEVEQYEVATCSKILKFYDLGRR